MAVLRKLTPAGRSLGWIAAIVAIAAGLAWFGLRPTGHGQGEGAAPAGVTVPSGQSVSLIDTIQGQPGAGGLTIRFRFLAPGIARDGGGVSVEAAQEDMAHLCETYALDRLPETGPVPAQVIISLSDRAVEFGSPDPEATQYFEAFSVTDGKCVWEGY